VPFWFGEGDKVTPQFIRDAVTEALQRGETFYGPASANCASGVMRYSGCW
jgi:hypothetical protein